MRRVDEDYAGLQAKSRRAWTPRELDARHVSVRVSWHESIGLPAKYGRLNANLQRCCALFVTGLEMLRGSYPETFVKEQEPELVSGFLGSNGMHRTEIL